MTKLHSILHKVLVATALAGSTIGAADAYGATAWVTSRIKQVYPLADGNFVLVLVDDAASCSSASTPKYYYTMVGQNSVSAEGVNKLYAAALAAAAQRLVVSVAFDDATSNCYINRVLVTYE